MKEAFFLYRDRDEGAERSPLVRRNTPTVAAALDFIEANLFEADGVESLCRRLGASESTLLRAFKRELGLTPAVYWRGRRLDEALALLRSGSASVATVALKVGYANPAAFAEAFKARFGQSPSKLGARARVRVRLPP